MSLSIVGSRQRMSREPFFSGPGLDRADYLRGDAAALEQLSRSSTSRELVWRDGLPSVMDDGTLEWQALGSSDLFLGLFGEAPCFSAIPLRVANFGEAWAKLDGLSANEAPVFAAALSLGGWHARSRFCSNCASLTKVVRGGWSRSCVACRADHFPRVDPVVIMLAQYRGSVLLGRQRQFPPGRFSALAGFVEVGETIEAAVSRELQEEAGISISKVSYVASQPWPFASSLMIGCMADAMAPELALDLTELEEARWFTRDEVLQALAGGQDAVFQAPPSFAIARTLIEEWLKRAGK